MVACAFGDWIDAILSSNVFSYQLGYFCCCFLFLARMWRSVPGPSDLLCPQAVINYRHVSPAQTPPFLPPRCDTGRIIILASYKNASAILVLEEFLSCCLLSAASIRHHSGWDLSCMHKITKKVHTCDGCSAVIFFVPCEKEERIGTFCGFTESWAETQLFEKCLFWERSCRLIRNAA